MDNNETINQDIKENIDDASESTEVNIAVYGLPQRNHDDIQEGPHFNQEQEETKTEEVDDTIILASTEQSSSSSSSSSHGKADDEVIPSQVVVTENTGAGATTSTISSPSSTRSSKSIIKLPSIVRKGVSSWVSFTEWLRHGISQFVLALSLMAARNPKSCISLVVVLSFSLITTGYFTNFSLDVNEEEMFTPYGSTSRDHLTFIRSVEEFPALGRWSMVIIHAEGDNVISFKAMDRLLRAVDEIRSLPLYSTVCPKDDDCSIHGPTQYFDQNTTLFREQTQGSDEAVFKTLSVDFLPNSEPAFQELMMGGIVRDSDRNITFAQSLLFFVAFPGVGKKDATTLALESEVIDYFVPVRDEWNSEPGNPYKLEFHTLRSAPDELMRAITDDMPLIPFVFIIMTLFTCTVFFRRDRVQSRSLLGVGAVVTIVMSMLTAYGIVFIAGVPFTSMTQILPFVVFGVGLDDTFIITGAYFRTDPRKDPVDRIQETMEEVGGSISLTTITTTVAFCLGCISTIPSIQWLCIYAALAIFVDFLYQITFFVSILVLDSERIKKSKMDCCICLVVAQDPPTEETDTNQEDGAVIAPNSRFSTQSGQQQQQQQQAPLAETFMDSYADYLLMPVVKIFVLVAFAAFWGVCSYSATKLIQDFTPKDFMPADSYSADFLYAMENFFDQSLRFPVYFRNVDQSDPLVQDQMIRYIDDMVGIDAFGAEPEFCWVRDFRRLANGGIEGYEEYEWIFNSNYTFAQQLDLILAQPQVGSIYANDIARDEEGNIKVSRCPLSVKNLDLNVVQSQVALMADIVKVSGDQPVNYGVERGQEPFFAFDLIFFLWEFYTLAVEELKFTTVSGIVTVSAIGFLLIPHWTAILFVFPLIVLLYICLLGTLQLAGLAINPLTYVCLVLSIGLLVDFNVHILLHYYESTESTREDKVKDTLRTIGASILVGALSTCLGIVPLFFSSSTVLQTVFTSFIAMVTLGIGHGVILLPVVLSICGPIDRHRLDSNSLKSVHKEDLEGEVKHESTSNE